MSGTVGLPLERVGFVGVEGEVEEVVWRALGRVGGSWGGRW